MKDAKYLPVATWDQGSVSFEAFANCGIFLCSRSAQYRLTSKKIPEKEFYYRVFLLVKVLYG